MRWRVFTWAGAAIAALTGCAAPVRSQSAPPAAQTAALAAQGPRVSAPTALDEGFIALYNLQFERAHAQFDRWVKEHPNDPLGPASHASAYLFQELNRLGILESEFLKDDKKLAARSGARSDARLRGLFYEQARRAEAVAKTHLARNPHHQDSLLALTISYGSQADYLNLVEKRPVASLPLFKKSNSHAQALLKLNPSAYDAWTASGFTEYLAGSLPFYVRWFVRFDSVHGEKQRALEQLRLAAARGRYLRPFAKILLAAVCLREKQLAESARLLEELREEFPANPLFAAELARLNSLGTAGK